MSTLAPYIRRAFEALRTYAGTFSTTVVTLIIGWAANRGIDIDATWLQIVIAGLISVVLLNLQKLALAIDARLEHAQALRWLVAITRLGAPPPEYPAGPTYGRAPLPPATPDD